MEGVRRSKVRWETEKTLVEIELALDGQGKGLIETPIGFLNHMIDTLAVHGRFDLALSAQGDLHVDQHHTVEDTGAALGDAFSRALGNRIGISRAGYFLYPMDEAIAYVAVDICGRPFCHYDVKFNSDKLGELEAELLHDFFIAFSRELRANLHVVVPYGRNDHHRAESVFKALGRALRMACSLDPRDVVDVPTTKLVLS